MKEGSVYIMANKKRTTLYIGVTSDLQVRVLQHKCGRGSKFTSLYKLKDLLYFEQIPGMQNAIDREKQLKNWHKDWKWNLIKEANPTMVDLAAGWYTQEQIAEYRLGFDAENPPSRPADAERP